MADSVAFPPLAVVVDEVAGSVWAPHSPDVADSGLHPQDTEALSPVAQPSDVAELPPAYESGPPPADSPWPHRESPEIVATAPPAAENSIGSAEHDEGEIDVAIEDDQASVLAPNDGVLSRNERRHDESGVDALGDVTVSTGAASSAIEVERPSFRVAAQPRRRVSASGAIVQLFGMAAGGAVGLAIGYWILLWLNPRADFLELRGKLPGWMMPGGRQHSSLEHTPAASPTGDAPASQRLLAGLIDDADAPLAGESPSLDAVQPADFTQTEPTDLADRKPPAEPPLDQPTPPLVGPRGFTPHESTELKSAIEAATLALRCEQCRAKQSPHRAAAAVASSDPDASNPPARKTPRCEHCRGTGVGSITAPVFERLCQLAETATFAHLDNADDAARDGYRNAAQDLMLLVGADRARGEVIGRLAADRLDNSQRPSNGVILCGSVAQAGYHGEMYVMRIVLSGIARTVTVVSRDAPQPPFGQRDHVLILGSIIDSPANNLAGYEGDEPQVIWGGVPFKLTRPGN
ncbi:MAG TPA: hypothetical protein VF306_00500 [Pirellulales bacterium]